MKKIIILCLLLCSSLMSLAYEITQKNDLEKSLVGYKISDNSQEVALIYLLDPAYSFHFFSVEDTPKMFINLETEVSKLKNITPSYALLADFSQQVEYKKRFSFSYAWNSLGILLFAPSYLKKVAILNPEPESKRFFMEIKIADKDFYSIIIFNQKQGIKDAKKIILNTKNLNQQKFKLYALLNFPIAIVLFDKEKIQTIYESHKNIKQYSCLYLADN